jgi:hypothetical protein
MSIFQPDPDPASEKMDRDPRVYENLLNPVRT